MKFSYSMLVCCVLFAMIDWSFGYEDQLEDIPQRERVAELWKRLLKKRMPIQEKRKPCFGGVMAGCVKKRMPIQEKRKPCFGGVMAGCVKKRMPIQERTQIMK